MSQDLFKEKPRVFISYARKDGEKFATRLWKRLQKEQKEIGLLWQDRAEMEGGVGWWNQIEEAIRFGSLPMC
jgi:TIR domain